MKKDNGVTAWKVISIILLVLLVGSFYYFISQTEEECLECEQCETCLERMDDKAILDVEMYDWGENLYDDSELLFDYWITNYGDIEAKNVNVRCKLSNVEQGVVFSALDNYGNLASRSSEFGEFTSKDTSTTNQYDEYSAYCYVESCDNCEILYKRVSELVEIYEEN